MNQFKQTKQNFSDLKKPPKGRIETAKTRGSDQKSPKRPSRLISSTKKRRFNSMQKCQSASEFLSLQPAAEEVTMTLNSLKMEFNRTKEENIKYRTRNSQLETLINTLYDDLHEQQDQIEKIFAGKAQVKAEFLKSSIALGLKRQLWEERTMNKLLADDLEHLKKSVKMTTQDEQSVEIKVLQKECQRLRKLLTKEIKNGEKNVMAMTQTHFNMLQTIANDEDRRSIANQFAIKDKECKEITEQNKSLTQELDGAHKQIKKLDTNIKKAQTDLSTRQAFLIKAKGEQIKMLTDSLQATQIKMANQDNLIRRNHELTKTNVDLNSLVTKLEKQVKQLNERPFAKIVNQLLPLDQDESRRQKRRKSQTKPIQLVHRSLERIIETTIEDKSGTLESSQILQRKSTQKIDNAKKVLASPLKQMSMPLVKQRTVPHMSSSVDDRNAHDQSNIKAIVEESILKEPMSFVSGEYLSSPVQESASTHFFKRATLSWTDLLCRGLKNFKALVQNTEQPHTDIEMAFYSAYGKEIGQLVKKLDHQTLGVGILHKVQNDMIKFNPQTTSLEEQVRTLTGHWSTLASELQVCKLVVKHVIPCIVNDQIDLKMLYNRIEMLLTTYSENSMNSEVLSENPVEESETEEAVNQPQIDLRISQSNTLGAPKDQVPKLKLSEFRALTPQIQTGSDSTKQNVAQHLSLFEDNHQEQIKVSDQQADDSMNQRQDTSKPNISSSGMVADSDIIRGRESAMEDAQEDVPLGIDSKGRPENTISNSSSSIVEEGPSVHNSITEDQMLDTAEQILNHLAEKLIQNGWSVHDVFGQPDEIIKIIPDHEGDLNIKILTPEMFLARVYQVGITDLTQLQVACLMKVLGKPEFEDSVRYNELELLMENFGVIKQSQSQETGPGQTIDAGSVIQKTETIGFPEVQTKVNIEKSIKVSDDCDIFIKDKRPHFQFNKKVSEVIEMERTSEEETNSPKDQDQYASDPDHSSKEAKFEYNHASPSKPTPVPKTKQSAAVEQNLLKRFKDSAAAAAEDKKEAEKPKTSIISAMEQKLKATFDNLKVQTSFKKPHTSDNVSSPKTVNIDSFSIPSEQDGNSGPKKTYAKEIHPSKNKVIQSMENKILNQFRQAQKQSQSEVGIVDQKPQEQLISPDETNIKDRFLKTQQLVHEPPVGMMSAVEINLRNRLSNPLESQHKSPDNILAEELDLKNKLISQQNSQAIRSSFDNQKTKIQTSVENSLMRQFNQAMSPVREENSSLLPETPAKDSTESISVVQSTMLQAVESSLKKSYLKMAAPTPNYLDTSPTLLIQAMEGDQNTRFKPVYADQMAMISQQKQGAPFTQPKVYHSSDYEYQSSPSIINKQESVDLDSKEESPNYFQQQKVEDEDNRQPRFASIVSEAYTKYVGNSNQSLGIQSVAEQRLTYLDSRNGVDVVKQEIEDDSKPTVGGREVSVAFGKEDETPPIDQSSQEQMTIRDQPQPATVVSQNTDQRTSIDAKKQDYRTDMRQQILNEGSESQIFQSIKDVLKKIKIGELLTQIEQNGYKQQVKSKTRMSETSIITQEAFFSICNMHTDIRLGQTDLDLLSECVQLTPKFSHLYTSKLLVILIQEIDEKRANNGSFLGQKLGSFTQS